MSSLERIIDAAALPVWVMMLVYFAQQPKGKKEWLFVVVLACMATFDAYATYRWVRGEIGKPA